MFVAIKIRLFIVVLHILNVSFGMKTMSFKLQFQAILRNFDNLQPAFKNIKTTYLNVCLLTLSKKLLDQKART